MSGIKQSKSDVKSGKDVIDGKKKTYESLLNHVILPRSLPKELSENALTEETVLICRMTEGVISCAGWIPERIVRNFQRFKRTHSDLTGKNVSRQIDALQPGDTFAVLVKCQQCVFIVHMPLCEVDAHGTKMVQIGTFPSATSAKEIYKCSGELQLTCPTFITEVEFSGILRSEAFSQQLCRLYETQAYTKKNQVPAYVNAWLTAILCRKKNNRETAFKMPVVTKKIRDEVIGKGEKGRAGKLIESWQRSPFYITMKALLQISLAIEYDTIESKFVHKIVMLRFITRFCVEFENPAIFPTLNTDLIGQLLAKMGRRIEKLATLKAQYNDDNHDAFYKQIVDEAKKSIAKMRARIDRQTIRLQEMLERKAQLKPLRGLDFENDIKQKIPKTQEYLEKRKTFCENENDYAEPVQQRQLRRHHMNLRGFPQFEIFNTMDELEKELYLNDSENWYLYTLPLEHDMTCTQLQKEYNDYILWAEKIHSGDPREQSIMMLIRLKFVAMMDRLVTQQFPLLLEHRTSIDTNIFDTLLLPQSKDMQIAHELQLYFERRNEAHYPSLVEESEITSESFAVRYGCYDMEIQEVRQRILEEAEQQIQGKKAEWLMLRQKAQQLRNKASALRCTQPGNMDPTEIFYHRLGCDKCSTEYQLKELKITQYQHPLPECIDRQNAIVFELRMPKEISIFRDLLQSINKLGHDARNKLDMKENWIEKELLLPHKTARSTNVILGSTITNHPAEFSIEDRNDFKNMVVMNMSNCVLHEKSHELCASIRIDCIQKLFTLNVETGSPYARLQWALISTNHTQNQVLARQAECPHNLLLSEFKEFGSLRADGHRLQLRKLYAMIETDAMSFDQPSVLSLVLQTIWQMGPNSKKRESHEDFINVDFAMAFIELLEKCVKHQEDNWANPTKLLTIVFIGLRIFELNDFEHNDTHENILKRIIEILHKIRAISLVWLKKIQNVLRETKEHSQDVEKSLRYSLAVVSITIAATFFVNLNHKYFDKIFERNPINGCSASRIWLMAIITLNNNIKLNSHVKQKAKTNLRMLTQLVRNTGIQIETKIRDLIKADPNDLFKLIETQWPDAKRGAFVDLQFPDLCTQMVVVDVRFGYEVRRVSIDFVSGKFLVNALPVDQLPENIKNDATHKRVFGDYTFEVQPHGRNCFTTIHEFNGCNYEFGLWNNSIIVTERRNDGKESELIPTNIMKTELPELLIEQFSHWWRKRDDVIEFRPKDFADENFAKESGIEYILTLNTSQLIEVNTERCMFSIASNTYQKIQEYLQRLEQPKFIHVLMETQTMAKVELIRLNLKFRIDCTKPNKVGGFDVMSDEFSKMRISLQQNCGTLYGLNHGLLLESIPNNDQTEEASKLLILPHSKINLTGNSVDIDFTSELRSPPFYRYQVDEMLRQLKPCNGNFSAWFYLAYLHAITSHGEAEPLTGMSGTERALQILQSSYVWSSAPYDIEAIKTLILIAHLSPDRSLITQQQKIEWPNQIPNHCAQDSFAFIVHKLIGDSERLHELHFSTDQTQLKKLKNASLNVRDYSRCLPLNPKVRVNDTFIKYKPLETSGMAIAPVSQSRGVRMIAHLYHEKAFSVPDHLELSGFLIDTTNVDGPIHIESVANFLNHQCRYGLSNMWISCYEIARKQKMNAEELVLLLSLMAHEGGQLDALLSLQAIANNPTVFQNINPPNVRTYSNPKGTFDQKEISNILISCPKNKKDVRTDTLRMAFENRIAKEVNQITAYIKSKWPCEQVNLIDQFTSESIAIADAETKIQQRITVWNDNKKLREFVEKIGAALKQLRSINVQITGTKMKPEFCEDNWFKYEIDIEPKMNQHFNDWPALEQAKMVWQMMEDSERTVVEWWSIYNAAVLSTDDKHLFDAGLVPRMVPSLVLPKLIDAKTHPNLKAIIGALALAIAREQRKNRLEAIALPGQDNRAYINWKPCDYPEWLLFEIEQDLTIRRIQIEIAKRMINPPDIGPKHSVMQLNMGEGKTAVIVPILASVLANGEQACQIIVLKSLFATNLNSLRQYLGGMLNKRIYIFPCRRDMPIIECVTKLLNIYEECKRMKGVILTLPEYLLSFQLKIYESIEKGNIYAAGKCLTVHKWINKNVRNIMDESDAILQAKYQLIYTVGNQLPLDGGVNRYAVTQAILKRVPHHMKVLYENFGDVKIEYDQKYIQNGQVYGAPRVTHRSDVFTPCRILDETVYDDLCKLLIDDFVNGTLDIQFPEMSETAKILMREFLSEQRNSSVMFNKVKSEFTSVHMDILMILSGLLQFNLLKLVLTRRWRVNYGVKENGIRKMAIPFKAKDVATEMTEFGHPDVAICYTQLSYYYSGLTDEQLIRVFGVLKSNVNAADIYDKWISTVPVELIQPSIELYSGINLDDPTQRDELLFPLFRYNMYVIDYWLSLDVFPREAKTFEKKLTCTAWDLCSDHFENRVTGFSGTNDTKNLLPLPIAQNDLKELEKTNENVRQILLRPENQQYQKLPANATGKMIIQELVNKKVPVLLDAGALMLEFNNEQMAREWLKMVSPINSDAAIYFDSKDVLQTVDRNGNIVEFDCSVYRDNLTRCLVYVDDVHTRGTDLKFPPGWKACVTLSGDITRDKTVQACMRMRQLGNGHAISFWASHEADTRIRLLCNLKMFDKITSEHVINFICKNSERFEMENTVHWASAAHNYAKKLAGHKLYENSMDPTALGRLYDSSVDNEVATLENLYGDKKEVKLSEITEWKFNELAKEFVAQPLASDLIQQIKRGVFDKIKDLDQICFRHALDEEQEKELEHEFEEQRQVERPPLSKPAKPSFDKRLHIFFLNGLPNDMRHLKTTGVLVPISQSLANTHLYESYYRENNAWSSQLYVTQDFISVLETDSEKCDNFLRPVWWIAGIQIEARHYWILLSSFECDRLLPTFRQSKNATLIMYRSRISKLHDNLLHERRLQVTGMINPLAIDLRHEVEIGVFGGSMFFKTNVEQNVFCNFIGSIPRPRSFELEQAFRNGIIKPNGFVPTPNRKLSPLISQCVGECKFNKNPAGMVIDLIIAHRQIMRKESHVASIVDGGIMMEIDNPDAVVADIKMEMEDVKVEPVDQQAPDEADEFMDVDQNGNLPRNLRGKPKRKNNNDPMAQTTLRRSKRFRSLV